MYSCVKGSSIQVGTMAYYSLLAAHNIGFDNPLNVPNTGSELILFSVDFACLVMGLAFLCAWGTSIFLKEYAKKLHEC